MCVCVHARVMVRRAGNRLPAVSGTFADINYPSRGSLIYQTVTKRLATLMPSVNVWANYSTRELGVPLCRRWRAVTHSNRLMCKYHPHPRHVRRYSIRVSLVCPFSQLPLPRGSRVVCRGVCDYTKRKVDDDVIMNHYCRPSTSLA